jgi:hypothetical protein
VPGYTICAVMENNTFLYRVENESVSHKEKVPDFDFQFFFPDSSVLQIPSFAVEFYANRNCRFFRLFKDEMLVGVCLVSEYLLNAEIQFGPQVISDTDIGIFVEKISYFYRKIFYGQIKINFPTSIYKVTFDEVVDHICEKFTITKEKKGNWSSLIIKLNEEIEKIQSGYSENLRRNIKKATQQGLLVRQITQEKDIIRLGNIFDKLYQKRNVKSQWKNSPATFLTWYQAVELQHKTIWFGVYNSNDKLLGGIMLVKQKNTVFYQLGATDPEERNLPVLHLCFHQALIFAKENHYSFFDFGGYDTDATEEDQTYNINSFKKQFGGELCTSFPNVLIVLNKPVKVMTDLLMSFRKWK